MTSAGSYLPVEKPYAGSNSSDQSQVASTGDRYDKTAKIVGLCFIVATVASSLGFALLAPILHAPALLITVAASTTQVTISVLLLLINCAAIVVIPILLFPILRRHSEISAVGYLGSRIIESAILSVGVISLLALLTLSRESTQTAAANPAYSLASGALLLAVYEWAIWLGIMIVFSLTALILNTALYRSTLVPRWLSGWGLIGATLLLAAGLLELFGYTPTEILSLPIALQEMVFAGWLLIKGFSPTARDFESTA